MLCAIDRDVLPKILQGGKTPATSWVPPGMLAHNPKIGLAFNPNEARRLLADAGYPDGKGLPPIVLGYNTQEDNKLVAEAIQSDVAKESDVVVKIENQEWKVYLKKLQTDPFVVFRAGWGADYPDPDNFMKLFTANSGNNHGRWKNPKYDQLLDQAASESDSAKRDAALRRSAKIIDRNRCRHRAAFLESRGDDAESQIHRLGI